MNPRKNRSLGRLMRKAFLAGLTRGFGYRSAGTGYMPGYAQSPAEARAQDARAIHSYWRETGQHLRDAMETVDAELRSKQQ